MLRLYDPSFGDPEESRTPNLLIRSQMLYPIKLRGQIDWGKYTAADEFYKKPVDFIWETKRNSLHLSSIKKSSHVDYPD